MRGIPHEKNMKRRMISIGLVILFLILQILSVFSHTDSVTAANSDFQTVLKKVAKVTDYAENYRDVGSPALLTASFITSQRYQDGAVWVFLEDDALNQELAVDGSTLTELQNLPNLVVPTGDSVDFNYMVAVLLKQNTYGGYPRLIAESIVTSQSARNESEAYQQAKSYFDSHKNMLLAAIDGENLTTLYQTNDSVNLDQLLSNYYEDTSSTDRYVTFLSDQFGETFDFTKDNLRQQFYQKLSNDAFFIEGLQELDFDIDDDNISAVEPLLRQCIYAFSDTIYDAYPNLKIQKMEFSVERSALEVNHDYNIPVTISPRNVKDAKITYTSSNPEIASVNENGTIHTNALGKFTLTATSGEVSAEKEFQVFEEGTTVSLDKKTLSLSIKQGEQLTATITPKESSQKVLWESENKQIATVTENGYVEAVAQGQTIIVASTETGATAECVVTVGQPVYAVQITDAPQYMEKGEVYTLEVIVNPRNATNADLVFSSSDESVLTVDETGQVTAIANGEATVTVEAVSDASIFDEKTIQVTSQVEEIIAEDEMNAFLGYTTPLQFELEPKDASEDQLIYEVSNDVISVDKKGNIFGNLLGDSEVTIKAKDNPSVQKTIEVHIVQPVTEIRLNETDVKLKKGETFSLTVQVAPNSAFDNSYSIEVANDEICSINGINHITGLKTGKTDVIVRANDGSGIESVCHVQVVSNIPFFVYILIPILIVLLIGGIVVLINRKKLGAYWRGR